MRRSTATVIGAAVIAVTVGAGTTGAIGASGGTPSAKTQARHIADSLTTAKGRAHYGLGHGRLIAADVCVRSACVHRDFSSAPICSSGSATCLGSALVARRFAHSVTISAELA
jgi:hypothetical protein